MSFSSAPSAWPDSSAPAAWPGPSGPSGPTAGRTPGVLALLSAVGCLVLSLVGVTWFADTTVGRAVFADVLDAGQRGAVLGSLSEVEGAWFFGLFLGPSSLTMALLLSSLPRSRGARITAAVLWLIAAGVLLLSLAVAIVEEIQAIEELSGSVAADKTEETMAIVAVLLVVLGVMCLLAWMAYRGRVVGVAATGTVLAMAATAIHLILLLKLSQGTGPERLSVSIGPWLVAAGLVTMSVAGWLLTSAASRSRRPPVSNEPPAVAS